MKAFVAFIACGALAGCQPGYRSDSPPESTSLRMPDINSAARSVAPVLRDTQTTAAEAALIALDGEGLRLVAPSNGATRLMPYGTDTGTVIAAVTASLGPPLSRGTNADCGAGPVDLVTFDGGLSIVVKASRFVGWSSSARNASRTLTTMSGIGVGATRAGLDSVYAATVSQTSVGVEFAAGGIFGVLDGDAPSARITDIWSGTSCVAR